MALSSKAAARGRDKLAVKNSVTTHRMLAWLCAKRHAQLCSICGVDCGKNVIPNVIEIARQRCCATQLTAKRHDQGRVLAGMLKKKRVPKQ